MATVATKKSIVRCPECNAWLVNTSPEYCTCPNGCGKLRPHLYAWDYLMALPKAVFAEKRSGRKLLFVIPGRQGTFVLGERFNPGPGVEPPFGKIAACYVTKGGNYKARLFEPAPSEPAEGIEE